MSYGQAYEILGWSGNRTVHDDLGLLQGFQTAERLILCEVSVLLD